MRKLALFLFLLGTASSAVAHSESRHGTAPQEAAASEEYAFGRAGDPKMAARTVHIDMSDRMRFTPARLTIRQGETVRFALRNGGRVMHEMVIGTQKDLKEHAALMRKYPTMKHDDPFGAHVAPGKTGTIVWQFTKAGNFQFGCLEPGHFEAGMVGQITVQSK